MRAFLGSYAERVSARLWAMEQTHAIERLWTSDPTLWKDSPAHREIIISRLGWLHSVDALYRQVDVLTHVARRVRAEGFTRVVLLGMGGSSLCVEVLRATFGSAPGFPLLTVLDSTNPEALRVCDGDDPAHTLYVVSTKSGTTIETMSLYRYARERVRAVKGEGVGENFVAITDANTPLAQIAYREGFRQTFLNPATIGGRYSVLSYVGMVPAALLGLDLRTLLERARRMTVACTVASPASGNPGVWLGAALGELALAGRDKATFTLSPGIESFGLWVEQLLAESTGKEGKGILPIVGEPLGPPSVYGRDRVFIALHLPGEAPETVAALDALQADGHPVIRFDLSDPYDLGAEFFRWEVATAVAGAVLAINPFDEPNVAESKANTQRVLDTYVALGHLPEVQGVVCGPGLICCGEGAVGESLPSILQGAMGRVQPGGYVALLVYGRQTERRDKLLLAMRTMMRDALKVPVVVNYGPRYLHSTGQIHKGGPNTGIFLMITADDPQDIHIPGERYSFGTLHLAQALGDYEALSQRGRRVLRFHASNLDAGLDALAAAITEITVPPKVRPARRVAAQKATKASTPKAVASAGGVATKAAVGKTTKPTVKAAKKPATGRAAAAAPAKKSPTSAQPLRRKTGASPTNRRGKAGRGGTKTGRSAARKKSS